MRIHKLILRFGSAACMLVLSACSSLPVEDRSKDVAALALARGGPGVASGITAGIASGAGADTNTAVTGQLAVEDAVRVALQRNPRVRAAYARVGLSHAELLQATQFGNPTLSAAYADTNESGAASRVSFGIAQNLASLIMRPARQRLASGELERERQRVAEEILGLATEVESDYYRLVGAQQVAATSASIASSAQASAKLAQRFLDAGNISELQLKLEQDAAAQARVDVMTARAEIAAARSTLNRAMGLTAAEAQWHTASSLPSLLRREDDVEVLQKRTQEARLDLASARREVTLLEDAQGVARRYRYLGDVEVGVEYERDTDRSRLLGPTLALQLPIFNQGQAGLARSKAELERSRADLHSLEIGISNGVQAAHERVMAARALAQHYRDEVIPLRKKIVDRTQEQANYMLVGTFDLIRSRQQVYDAQKGYVQALRDYWLARVDLAREVGAELPSAKDVKTAQSAAPRARQARRKSGAAGKAVSPPPQDSTATHRHSQGGQS